jgi:hypothetical protein
MHTYEPPLHYWLSPEPQSTHSTGTQRHVQLQLAVFQLPHCPCIYDIAVRDNLGWTPEKADFVLESASFVNRASFLLRRILLELESAV